MDSQADVPAEVVYRSNAPSYRVPTELSFPEFIANYNPELVSDSKVILEDHSKPRKKLTYGESRSEAARIAYGFKHLFDLADGGKVAIISPNCVNWVLAWLGTVWAGGVAVGVSHLATSSEMQNYLKIAQSTIAVVDASLEVTIFDAMQSLAPEYRPKHVLFIGGTDLSRQFPDCVTRAQKSLPPYSIGARRNDKVEAARIFSSGTSGRPKGVRISHHGLIATVMAPQQTAPEITHSRLREVFFPPPVAHVFGLGAVILPTTYMGSYVMLMRQFEYGAYVQAASDIQATMIRCVPAIAMMLSKDSTLDRLDLSSVETITCAGATLGKDPVERLKRLMPSVSIIQGYGMSEAGICLLRPRESIEKAGSVGRLFANVELRLLDDNLQDVSPGKQGEAVVKAPTVMMGYHDDPDSTNEAFHNGWLRTGDVLQRDIDGVFWFIDRKKELIKYKGMQVPPAELEDVLSSHPLVVEAAVTALWDASQETEVPVGYAVLRADVPKADRLRVLAEIHKWFSGRVAGYKKLRGGLHYIEALPKNATGKVVRNQLPARVAALRKTKL